MTDKNIDLSNYNPEILPDSENMSFGIVVSEWNPEVTNALKEGALGVLLKNNVDIENITVEYVPGSFELPLVASWMLAHLEVDAVICLGCIIQGETPHFEYISRAVASSISALSINYSRPVIFGVLTTNDMQQAMERAGGTHGLQGDEAERQFSIVQVSTHACA